MKEIITKTYELEKGDLVWVKDTKQIAIVDYIKDGLVFCHYWQFSSHMIFSISQEEVTYVKNYQVAYAFSDIERIRLEQKLVSIQKELVNILCDDNKHKKLYNDYIKNKVE